MAANTLMNSKSRNCGRSRDWRRSFLTLSTLFFATAVCTGDRPPHSHAANVLDFAGSRTRAVWLQDMGTGSDFEAQADRLRLMGFDSTDEQGEFVLLGDIKNYARPLITRRGDRVIFSSRRAKKVYIINWDGSRRRELTHGLGIAVWIDPDSTEEWVYVARPGPNTDATGWPMGSIWRYPIDREAKGELVWDLTHVDVDNFQVSADGSRAGGLFPWPSGGTAFLPNISWEKHAEGCWTSMAPDNSYVMWVFDGSHRDLFLFDEGGVNRRTINLSRIPGIDNHEVNHPRWSNHSRYMAMTAPYRLEGGVNRLEGGGAGVEIFLGRFDDKFTRIEGSIQLTHNDRGDYFPDVWIEAGYDEISTAKTRPDSLQAVSATPRGSSGAWPVNSAGTVFIWENRLATNQIFDAQGDLVRSCRVEPRGYAWYGRFSDMNIQGGAFVAQDVDSALLDACRDSNELCVEALITPEYLRQGPAPIISYSSNGADPNFSLRQEGDSLVFNIRTTDTHRTSISLVSPFRFNDALPHYIQISYRSGMLVCYVDGQSVFRSDNIEGEFSAWTEQTLCFGSEFRNETFWTGRLEGIAVINRFIEADEARLRAEEYRERLNEREEIERITVTAKLVEPCQAPDPKSIAPYHRALVVQGYEVESVYSGSRHTEKILIAHWAILDGEPIKGMPEDMGSVYRLTVERFEDHPELEPERLVMDTQDFESPLFYDVGEIGARRNHHGSADTAASAEE